MNIAVLIAEMNRKTLSAQNRKHRFVRNAEAMDSAGN